MDEFSEGGGVTPMLLQLTDSELTAVAADLKRLSAGKAGRDDMGMGCANCAMHFHAECAMNAGLFFPSIVTPGLSRPLFTVAWWRPGIVANERSKN